MTTLLKKLGHSLGFTRETHYKKERCLSKTGTVTTKNCFNQSYLSGLSAYPEHSFIVNQDVMYQVIIEDESGLEIKLSGKDNYDSLSKDEKVLVRGYDVYRVEMDYEYPNFDEKVVVKSEYSHFSPFWVQSLDLL